MEGHLRSLYSPRQQSRSFPSVLAGSTCHGTPCLLLLSDLYPLAIVGPDLYSRSLGNSHLFRQTQETEGSPKGNHAEALGEPSADDDLGEQRTLSYVQVQKSFLHLCFARPNVSLGKRKQPDTCTKYENLTVARMMSGYQFPFSADNPYLRG